ncbi:PROTEIN LOL1 [Salix viminalis]|uniref:PROTEIN LOL1 n=1 Tax=Salix viminalis TaxID=40686 RepID=A0A9Q0QD79_SALVM|nr:PROTEIN LOL1 [Salix viminalis]
MPVPLAPYPAPPAPCAPPPPPPPPPAAAANGAQSQLVCSGCRNLLLYPVGANSVCCAVCNAVTAVPPPGTEMAQLVCGGCHTLLMYIRGATSVQCSCCHTVNLALEGKELENLKSSGACQLWELQDAADVPIRSTKSLKQLIGPIPDIAAEGYVIDGIHGSSRLEANKKLKAPLA